MGKTKAKWLQLDSNFFDTGSTTLLALKSSSLLNISSSYSANAGSASNVYISQSNQDVEFGSVVFNSANLDKDFIIRKSGSGVSLVYDAGLDSLTLDSSTFELHKEGSKYIDTFVDANLAQLNIHSQGALGGAYTVIYDSLGVKKADIGYWEPDNRLYFTTLNGATLQLNAPADGALLQNAPTGGTANAIATVGYVNSAISGEDFWQRNTTTLSPQNAGDSLSIDAAATFNAAGGLNNFSIKKSGGTDAYVYDAGSDTHLFDGNSFTYQKTSAAETYLTIENTNATAQDVGLYIQNNFNSWRFRVDPNGDFDFWSQVSGGQVVTFRDDSQVNSIIIAPNRIRFNVSNVSTLDFEINGALGEAYFLASYTMQHRFTGGITFNNSAGDYDFTIKKDSTLLAGDNAVVYDAGLDTLNIESNTNITGDVNITGTAILNGDELATKADANIAAQAFAGLQDAKRVANGGVDGRNLALTTVVQQLADPAGISPIQICSLSDGNVIKIYKSGADFLAGIIDRQIAGKKGSIHVETGLTPGTVITATGGATSVAALWGLNFCPITCNFEGYGDTKFFGYSFRNSRNENHIDYTTHTLEAGVQYLATDHGLPQDGFPIQSIVSNTSGFTDDMVIISDDAVVQLVADGLNSVGQTAFDIYSSTLYTGRTVVSNSDTLDNTAYSGTGVSVINNGNGTLTITDVGHGWNYTNGDCIKLTNCTVGSNSGQQYMQEESATAVYFGVLSTTTNTITVGGSSVTNLTSAPYNDGLDTFTCDYVGVRSIRTSYNDTNLDWNATETGTLQVHRPGFAVREDTLDFTLAEGNETGFYAVTAGAVSSTVTVYAGASMTPLYGNGLYFEIVNGAFTTKYFDVKTGEDRTNTKSEYTLDPFETVVFFTKGNGEYRIEATQPVFVSTAADGGYYDQRILPPLSTEIIGHFRSGYCSAVESDTEVFWYAQDLTFGKFTVNPGSPVTLNGSGNINEFGNCYQLTTNDTPPTAGTFDLTIGSDTATLNYDATADEIVYKLSRLFPDSPVYDSGGLVSTTYYEPFTLNGATDLGTTVQFNISTNGQQPDGETVWISKTSTGDYEGASVINAMTGLVLEIDTPFVAGTENIKGKVFSQIVVTQIGHGFSAGDDFYCVSSSNTSRFPSDYLTKITHVISPDKFLVVVPVASNTSGNTTVNIHYKVGKAVGEDGIRVLIKNGLKLSDENVWCGIFHQNSIGSEFAVANGTNQNAPTPSIGARTQTFDGSALTGTISHTLLQAVASSSTLDHANPPNPTDYGIEGFGIMRASKPITAFSGADAAGVNATPWYPLTALVQRVGLPLGNDITASSNGAFNSIAIASTFRGTARVKSKNGALKYPSDFKLKRGTVDQDPATPWEQLFPCAATIVIDQASGWERGFSGGIVDSDVPIYCVHNSNLNQRIIDGGIDTNSDESAFSGITPPELKSKYEFHYDEDDGFVYKVSFKGGQFVTKKM
jgi:hypothetical protein